MSTQLFLRSGLSASGNQSPAAGALPSGLLAAWNQTNSGLAGASAAWMETSAGAAQLSVVKSGGWSNVPNSTVNTFLGWAQYLSNPLAAQSISAGNWSVGFAGNLLPTQAGAQWRGAVAIYLINGATGAIRTTIFALALVTGDSLKNTNSETTAFSTTLSGGAATATAGDYLCVEIGMDITTNSSGAITPNASAAVYDSGTTAILSSAVTTASAKSFLTCPTTLTFLNTTTTSTPSSSANPAASGANVTFKSSVTSGGGTPTGTVNFLDGASTLGTGLLASGTASLVNSTLSIGTHTMTAAYLGDANFATSTSGALGQTITSATASATVLVGNNFRGDFMNMSGGFGNG